MKAIIYARFSPRPKRGEVLSIKLQRQRCEGYCEMKGLDVLDVIEEPEVSAGVPLHKRPGGQRVLELVKGNGKAKSIVILKLDRMFRNAADCLNTVEGWDKARVVLHIVDLGGNAINTTSAAGRFMLTVLAGAAEMERNLIRERTAAAMRAYQRSGRRMGSRAPYGWVSDPEDDSRIIEDPDQQHTIQLILETHAKGHGCRTIAQALNEMGILCLGHAWKHWFVQRLINRHGNGR